MSFKDGHIPWNKGKKQGYTVMGMLGKSHSEQSKLKNALTHKGKKNTEESKIKLSNARMGMKFSDDHKRKLRIAKCERLQRLGIGGNVDEGADEYFDNLNLSILTNYYLKDLGYYVDGYDIVNNTVYEYDTPYHNSLRQKQKDAVRQNNIIQYFKDIDNPLNAFIRISSVTHSSKVERQ